MYFFVWGSSLGFSQFLDPFLLNNTNRSIFNPAFAGIENGKHVTSFGYRSSLRRQMGYFNNPPNPVLHNGFDLNGFSKNLYSGFGANIAHNFNQYSSRNYQSITTNPGFNHYTSISHNLNVKLNCNFKLNVVESSIFAFGMSVGLFLHDEKIIYENADEKSSISAISAPILSFGTSYSNKNLFLGFSVGDMYLNNDFFDHLLFLSLNTGYNWTVNDRLILEPNFFIKYSFEYPSVIMLQNNFVYLKKYNLGGGFSENYYQRGFHIFTGLLLKEKLKLNLAYKKFHFKKLYGGSQGYWLNNSGLEISAVFKINSSLNT